MSTMSKPALPGLALVAGIAGFSASASADWQGRVWGVSVEEADKAFRVPHTKPWPGCCEFEGLRDCAPTPPSRCDRAFADRVL